MDELEHVQEARLAPLAALPVAQHLQQAQPHAVAHLIQPAEKGGWGGGVGGGEGGVTRVVSDCQQGGPVRSQLPPSRCHPQCSNTASGGCNCTRRLAWAWLMLECLRRTSLTERCTTAAQTPSHCSLALKL